MSFYKVLRLGTAVLILVTTGILPASAQTRRIVLLYDERPDLPGLSKLDEGFVRVLTSNAKDKIEVYREALDLSRFGSDSDYVFLLRDYLHAKYKNKEIDVAVAVMGPSLDFLLNYGDFIFPKTPVVFCGIDRRELGARRLPAHVTGVLVKRQFAPTLELALTLHPGTKNIVFVAGTSEFDRRLLEQARKEFAPFEDRLHFKYLTSLPMSELLQELSHLPPQTIVLCATVFQDGAGVPFIPHEVVRQVSKASNSPVYGFVDQFLGLGIVGGFLYSMDTQGKEAAELTKRILAGANVSSLPLIESGAGEFEFDWREMQRWKISSSSLPQASSIQFRPQTFWNQYKRYAIAAISIMALQLLTIGGLLVQRTRRRKVEAQLRESESRFRTMADAAPVMIWMSGLDKKSTWCNQRLIDFVGQKGEQLNDFRWRQNIHPDDFDHSIRVYESSFDERRSFTKEFRIKRFDGAYRWVLDCGIPLYGSRNEFLGFIGSWIDITERKEAELEMQRHREELAHIARVRMMGEFTVSVAHELKQPLGAILSNAGAAELFLNADPLPIHEIRKALTDICDDTLRSTEIIHKLRRLLERHEIVRKPIDVNYAVEEIVRLMTAEAAARRVRISFEPEKRLPNVNGDRVHLQQVVMNLVLNSFEAMASVGENARRVCIRTGTNGNGTVMISVSDSGPGIPEDRLSKLFEPFYTTKEEGLGMGLSISRTIMEAHDGRVWAENNTDSGATFHIELSALHD